MSLPFIEKVTGFLLRPTETFQKCRTETLVSAFLYYLPLLVIYVIFSILVMSLVGSSSLQIPEAAVFFRNFLILAAILLLLGGILGPFIAGALLQIGVILVGGTKEYVQSVKAYMYASTPLFLLGWIPIISIIAMIWHLVLVVLGIRELQEISMGNAIVAVVITIVVCIVIAVILALLFAVAIASAVYAMAGTGTPV